MARPAKATRDDLLNVTRQALLDAAADEFAGAGYNGANINRISTAAGFAKGTIYNYFASKHALMLALIDEIAAVHITAILDHVEPLDTPVDKLEGFFRSGFAFVEAHPAQARLIINAVYGPEPAFKERVYEVYMPVFDLLINGILAAGIARGDFRAIDPDETAGLIMTVYLGSCSLIDERDKIMVAPAQVVDFILNGIRREVC